MTRSVRFGTLSVAYRRRGGVDAGHGREPRGDALALDLHGHEALDRPNEEVLFKRRILLLPIEQVET